MLEQYGALRPTYIPINKHPNAGEMFAALGPYIVPEPLVVDLNVRFTARTCWSAELISLPRSVRGRSSTNP
jgi:hypothetical protein